jgi:hypothetical protein
MKPKIFEQEQIARAVELGLGVSSPADIEVIPADEKRSQSNHNNAAGNLQALAKSTSGSLGSDGLTPVSAPADLATHSGKTSETPRSRAQSRDPQSELQHNRERVIL